MQCVILAAGKGTRMRPLTDNQPKPLIEVGGRPILEHIIDALPPEVDSLVIVVQYLQDLIRARIGDRYHHLPVTYVEHPEINGTGGALSVARQAISGRFLVMLADDLHGADALSRLVREDLAILGAIADDPRSYGVLTLSPSGTLVGIEEKPEHPKSNFINTGAMVLDEDVFRFVIPAVRGEVRLTDMVTELARTRPVQVIAQPLWCPLGTPEDLVHGEVFLKTLQLRNQIQEL